MHHPSASSVVVSDAFAIALAPPNPTRSPLWPPSGPLSRLGAFVLSSLSFLSHSGCPRSLWGSSGTTISSYGSSGSSRVLTGVFSLLLHFRRLRLRSDAFSSFFGLPRVRSSSPDAPDVSVSSVVGMSSQLAIPPSSPRAQRPGPVPSLRGFVGWCGWFKYVIRYILEPFWVLTVTCVRS